VRGAIPVDRTEFGEQRIGGLVALPAADRLQIHEDILERQAAGQEELFSVTGWTVCGKTIFMAEYRYDIEGEYRTASRLADHPLSTLTEQHLDFLGDKGALFEEMVETGQAIYLGAEDAFVNGVPIRFRRWRAEFSSWGQVIFWKGLPATNCSESGT
jgi:hypothetical protein